jgi:DNA polymerase-2
VVAPKRSFDGSAVVRIDVQRPTEVAGLRERLHAAGVQSLEADVRFPVRYLIERGIKGGCAIDGPATRGSGRTWVFDNPQLHPATVQFAPRVLSFDIETDTKAERLLAIALYGCGVDEVLIVDGSGRPMPEKAMALANERAALDAFCARVRALDPDVLTGCLT